MIRQDLSREIRVSGAKGDPRKKQTSPANHEQDWQLYSVGEKKIRFS